MNRAGVSQTRRYGGHIPLRHASPHAPTLAARSSTACAATPSTATQTFVGAAIEL